LVESFVAKAISEHIFRCNFLTANSDDAVIELHCLLQYTKEFYDILNPAIIYDLEKNHELAYSQFKNHKSHFIHQTLKANMERGVKMGLYREDFDIDIITRFLLESITFISDPGTFRPALYDKIEPIEEILVCLISGIVTTVGMEIVRAYKVQRNIALLCNCENGPFWHH
jgi:hypothetical protein